MQQGKHLIAAQGRSNTIGSTRKQTRISPKATRHDCSPNSSSCCRNCSHHISMPLLHQLWNHLISIRRHPHVISPKCTPGQISVSCRQKKNRRAKEQAEARAKFTKHLRFITPTKGILIREWRAVLGSLKLYRRDPEAHSMCSKNRRWKTSPLHLCIANDAKLTSGPSGDHKG